METCDTLFMVGTSFPYIEFYPKPGKARGVQIDIDPARIGLRYPVEVGLVGDSRRTLEQLLAHAEAKERPQLSWRQAQSGMKEWQKLMEERGYAHRHTHEAAGRRPRAGQAPADNAIVSCDSGTITTWWARHIPSEARPDAFVSPALWRRMACGLPYAIAAQVAYPDRPCIAFVGDGGFSMLMAEFATAVKYKLPIKVVIIKNNSLGQIKWEQMVFLGNPEYGCDLQPIDFAAFARACGGHGLHHRRSAEVRASA